MNQEKVGKFIAELRKQNKLTQEQLAEKLGITKNAVSKWERGLGLMDLSLLKSLSQILGVSDINDSDSYVDKGILINTYYCVKDDDIVTVIPTFKNVKYNCPIE